MTMVYPGRTPMIIPGCGHVFCDQCIKKIKECLLCHHEINCPTKNMIEISLFESIKDAISTPPELNLPAPSENKLLLKIEPLCIFAVTSDSYAYQGFYQFRKCFIFGNRGFCEIYA